jgi:acetyl-CoA acetyltransferase family protein
LSSFKEKNSNNNNNNDSDDHDDVYLVYYKRTAFSKSKPSEPEKDVFNSIRMDQALAYLIKDCISTTAINPIQIDDLIIGCALQIDENWAFGGRHPLLLAGLPVEVPSYMVDRQCASSLQAIGAGAMEIMSGNSDVVIAAGMEHLTHVPMVNNPHVRPNFSLLGSQFKKYDMATAYSMGMTAEKLASQRSISREAMDEFSLESHLLASKALKRGYFKDEILPIEVEWGGKKIVVDQDQSIRSDAKLEQMQKLAPVFSPNGVITAGNSSPMNAGASLVMLMSERKMNEYGLKPLTKIISIGWAGVDPSIMGEGVVPATRKALAKAKLKPQDIDLWEINEAFAVVVLNAMKELDEIPREKVNPNGGAIAIGHPLGASGARLAGTLSRMLNQTKNTRGVATLCVGGGQGYSVVFEKAS